jgi:hypothetical protein
MMLLAEKTILYYTRYHIVLDPRGNYNSGIIL